MATQATAAQIFQVFKEVYGDRIEAQANKSQFLYKEFDKSKEEMAAGKYFTFPVLDDAGWGAVGARKDGKALPPPIAESPLQTQIYPRYNYGLIQVSGPAMAQSKDKVRAFMRAKDLELTEKTKTLMSDMARQCYNGSHGDLGVELSDAANSITLTTAANMNWFHKGDRIDIYDSTAATKRNGTAGVALEGRDITAVNKATRTITYGGTDISGSTAATDRIFKEDIRNGFAGTAEGAELTGLHHIIDDGTDSNAIFQNIDRASVAIWKGLRHFNGGVTRPLTLNLIQDEIDSVTIESGEDTDFLLSDLTQRKNYTNLLWFDVRYEPQVLKGGWKVLQYSGGGNSIDWLADRYCPSGEVIGLVRDSIKRYEVQPLGILDMEGTGTVRVTGFDMYELLIGTYGNLGARRCNCNFRLGDLS